jgi:hypothetical protein
MERTVPPIPSDPGLPGARGLFGQAGRDLVGSFLSDRGWSVTTIRPVQAMYRPGRSLIVRYRTEAEGPTGKRSLMVCAETRARKGRAVPVHAGFEDRFDVADPVERRGHSLVWTFPYDPSLEGLPDAAWGPSVRGAGPGKPVALSVQPLRYRPRRRAVFRYRVLHADRPGLRWETAFGKVLPHDKADRLAGAAPSLVRAGRRVPLALPAGRVGQEMLMFPELAGRSLRDLLLRGGSLPAPARVAALPVALASAVRETGAPVTAERPSPIDVVIPTADVVGRLAPEAEAEARRVVDAVREGIAVQDVARSVVHGDLYEAQVFVGDRFTLGLIDLDDLGLGDPALDAANFCAHLLALAMAAPAAADRLVAYRRLVRPAFARALGLPVSALAWREALCMLLLAPGPFRVLDPAWPAEVGRRAGVAVRLLEER